MALNVTNINWTPLYDLGRELVQAYKVELFNQKVNASGALSASANFDVDFDENDVTLYFIYNSYGYFIEHGRKPTHGGGESWTDSVGDISRWIENKINRGWFIPRNGQTIPRTPKEIKRVAYAIVKKIHQFGFYDKDSHGLHILEDILERAEWRGKIEKAYNQIAEQYSDEINLAINEFYD